MGLLVLLLDLLVAVLVYVLVSRELVRLNVAELLKFLLAVGLALLVFFLHPVARLVGLV